MAAIVRALTTDGTAERLREEQRGSVRSGWLGAANLSLFQNLLYFSCQIVARWDNEGCGVYEWDMSQRKGEFLFQRPVSAPSLEEEAMGFLTLEASPRLQITTLSLHLDGTTATRYLLQGGLKPHLHIFSQFYRLKAWDLGAGAGGGVSSFHPEGCFSCLFQPLGGIQWSLTCSCILPMLSWIFTWMSSLCVLGSKFP